MADSDSFHRKYKSFLLGFVLVAATGAAYGQVCTFGFVAFDDHGYVTQNKHVAQGLSPATVRWALSAFEQSNWHPLTWISHALDCTLFGLDPGRHHLTSLLLHMAGTLLLFRLLLVATQAPWESFFVAGMFALHPLHVESVAWISERKDVLSGMLWILTLLLYVRYTKRPGRWTCLLVAFCFALGLMAKQMLVTLPAVLLIVDWWPLGRWGAGPGQKRSLPLLVEKIPLFALSLGAGLLALAAQRSGQALRSLELYPAGVRVANAIVSYAAYLGDMLWPAGLAVLYPHTGRPAAAAIITALALLAGISAGAFFLRRRAPWLLAGWLWYLVTLLPVIGLVQVGMQARADRYTYIPMIGIAVMLAWGIPPAFAARRRMPLFVAAMCVLCALGWLTWRQARVWRDSVSLFRHAVAVTANNYVMRTNLAMALAERGDRSGAIAQYRAALRIRPDHFEALVNLANVFYRSGAVDDAVPLYERALRRRPDSVLACSNLGIALLRQGKSREALGPLERAYALQPDDPEAAVRLCVAHKRAGELCAAEGRLPDAVRHYRAALRLQPGDVEAQERLRLLERPQLNF